MTALAARRTPYGVTLGADSLVRLTYPDQTQLDGYRAAKLARVSWGALGGAGDLAIVQDLRETAVECATLADFAARVRRRRGDWELIATDGTTILLIGAGSVTSAPRYAAAGTGGQVALGALAAGASVRRAHSIYATHSKGVGGEITTVNVPRR